MGAVLSYAETFRDTGYKRIRSGVVVLRERTASHNGLHRPFHPGKDLAALRHTGMPEICPLDGNDEQICEPGFPIWVEPETAPSMIHSLLYYRAPRGVHRLLEFPGFLRRFVR